MQPRLWLLLATQLAALHGSVVLHQTPGSLQIQTDRVVTLSCDVKYSSSIRVYWLRQHQTRDSSYEFLASCDLLKGTSVYGNAVAQDRLNVYKNGTIITLKLMNGKPADSGFYFCMIVGNPELTFGKGTKVNVVDILPTSAPPTKKPAPKKKPCRFPNPEIRKDLPCGPITLGLLVAGVVILLVSLGVAIHHHCQRKRARLRLIKQVGQVLTKSSRCPTRSLE